MMRDREKGKKERADEMKINKSESDNAKFLSEFLFWIVAVAGQSIVVVVVEETIQYGYSTIKTINQSIIS
jgi:hypothetical protein